MQTPSARSGRYFRLFWAGQTVSLIGDQLNFVALAWLVLHVTGSGLVLGTVFLASALPRGALMLLGGALADKLSPRTSMLGANAVRALLVGSIALMILTQNFRLEYLYVVAVLVGVADAAFYPASLSILPSLVNEDRLERAIALVNGSQQAAKVVGPLLAGVVIAWVGVGAAFALDAVSFIAADACLLAVRAGPSASTHRSFISGLREGLAYFTTDRKLVAVTLVNFALYLAFTGPLNVALPVLARSQFGGGALILGVLVATWGAGVLVGTIVSALLRATATIGRPLLLLALCTSVGFILLSLAKEFALVCVLLLATGVAAGVVGVTVPAWLQRRTPRPLLGRIASVYQLSTLGALPLSIAITSVLIGGGPAATFMLSGLFVLTVVIAAAPSRTLRSA